MRALGLTSRGASFWTIKQRVAELGLDVAHFTAKTRSLAVTRLQEVVAASSSFVDVLRALGRPVNAAEHSWIRRRVSRFGIDASHLRRPQRPSGRRSRWTDDQLRAAVAAHRSMAGVLRALGLVPAGGNYEQVHRRIGLLDLDTSHFTGQAWIRGRTLPVDRVRLADLLVANRLVGSHDLKLRLFRAGLKSPACELCGWAQQASDGRIPVELDHMNGDRLDNRLENLRILCPNCHALQPTHRGLNKRSRRSKA